MDKSIAYANNDVAFIVWSYAEPIADCLGFAIYRHDYLANSVQPLPAWVGFEGDKNKDWQPHTTEEWPIQKFSWKDVTASRGRTYSYDIVPMVGKPGSLTPLKERSLSTNKVTLQPTYGSFSAYFNRGILSTQFVSHQIPAGPSGAPNYKTLISRIDQPGDPLRLALAGQMLEALQLLLNRAANEGGKCYCALYELNDPDLVKALTGNKRVALILSNTGPDDATDKAARQTLHESGIEIYDRMLANGHIGHNKFIVYVDAANKPQAVLSGSANWTYTAICGQSNNSIIINSLYLAALYFDYWQRIKAEGDDQSASFRSENDQAHDVTIDGNDVTVWFSPNTKAKSKTSGAAAPDDMKQAFELISAAKSGILFLLFQPGSPSVADAIKQAQEANGDLFIRGAATDPNVAKGFDDVKLFHKPGAEPDTVVAATAITDQFSYWQKELLKSSPDAHAIIHDKIVVIDPFSPDCVVITGSHNQGYRASYNNDENLLFIRGNRALAAAYATHVIDVYDHYRWRFVLAQQKKAAWTGLDSTAAWQDKYFAKDSPHQQELAFWL